MADIRGGLTRYSQPENALPLRQLLVHHLGEADKPAAAPARSGRRALNSTGGPSRGGRGGGWWVAYRNLYLVERLAVLDQADDPVALFSGGLQPRLDLILRLQVTVARHDVRGAEAEQALDGGDPALGGPLLLEMDQRVGPLR